MTIDIPGVPQGELVPITWFQIIAAGAPFSSASRVLLIGERVGGTADDNTPYLLSSSNVEDLFGRGSMVAAMYRHVKKINPLGEVWGISQDSSGSHAT